MDPIRATTTKKTPRSNSTASKGGGGGGGGGDNNNNSNNNNNNSVTFDVGARKKKKKDRSTINTKNQKVIPDLLLQQQSSTNSDQLQKSGTESQQQSQSHHHHSQRHPKDTATADGHMMSEMLNTFSTNEYNRFESYQRSSFSASFIEPFIAACIEHKYNIYNTKTNSSTNNNILQQIKLEDYVAPGQATEIGLVVAIAAKIYAQRLITEASYLQKKDILQQKEKEKLTSKTNSNNNNNNTDSTEMDTSGTPTSSTTTTTTKSDTNSNVLLCTYVYKAVQDRQRRGIDPGFFMSMNHQYDNRMYHNEYNITNTTNHLLYDTRRLATIAAIENYNSHHQQKNDSNVSDETNNNMIQTTTNENDVNVLDTKE